MSKLEQVARAHGDQITPEIVERAITEAGRDEVFWLMRENGWGKHTPPLWVWYHAAQDIMAKRRAALKDTP